MAVRAWVCRPRGGSLERGKGEKDDNGVILCWRWEERGGVWWGKWVVSLWWQVHAEEVVMALGSRWDEERMCRGLHVEEGCKL